jgi:hypothetical protein
MKKFLLLGLLFLGLYAGKSKSQVIFYENFDAGNNLPAGWINSADNDLDWRVVDSAKTSYNKIENDRTTGSGKFCVFNFVDTESGVYKKGTVTSPVIDLSSTTNPVLSFSMNRPYSYENHDMLMVSVIADGNLHFNLIPDLDHSTLNWLKVKLDLSAYKFNDVQIQFTVIEKNYSLVGIDDIMIYENIYDSDSKLMEPAGGQIQGDTIDYKDHLSKDDYLEVFRVDVADLHSSDNNPTIITKATFYRLASSNINVSTSIIDADVFQDGKLVEKNRLDKNFATLSFTFDEGTLNITDTSTISLKIAFDTVMYDLLRIGFNTSLGNYNWETSDTGSRFPENMAAGSIDGNLFVVDFDPVKLEFFNENNHSAFIDEDMTPFPKIYSADIYGNWDLNFCDSVSIINSAGIAMKNNTVKIDAGNGLFYFRHLQFAESGSDITLTTSNSFSLENATSSVPLTVYDQIIFEDDFETDKGWTLSGEFEIGKPENVIGGGIAWDAFSGVKALTLDSIDNYEPNIAAYQESAISPVINVAGNYEKSALMFEDYSVFQNNDYGLIDFSTDNGTSWSNADTIENIWPGWWSSLIIPIDVPDASNELVIRFSFASNDDGYEYDGWNIDNFRIVAIEKEMSSDNIIVSTEIGQLQLSSINNIPAGTTVSELLNALTLPAYASAFMLVNSGGSEITEPESTPIDEDMVVLVTAENGLTKAYNVSLENSGTQTDITGRQKLKPILIYPIPANDIVNVEFPDVKEGKVTVSLLNIEGKTLINQIYGKGHNAVHLNVSDIDPGMYYLKLVLNDETVTRIVIVN